jgi:hypothetical protein
LYRFVLPVVGVISKPAVQLRTVAKCCTFLAEVCRQRDSRVDHEAITPLVVEALGRVFTSQDDVVCCDKIVQRFLTSCCKILKALEQHVYYHIDHPALRPFVVDKPSFCLGLVQPLCKWIGRCEILLDWPAMAEVVYYLASLARSTANHEVLKSPAQGCVTALTRFIEVTASVPRGQQGRYTHLSSALGLVRCAWGLYATSEEFSVEDVQCLDALERLVTKFHFGGYLDWPQLPREGILAKVKQAQEQRRRWERRWTPLRAGWIGGVGCHQATLADTLTAEAALEAALVGEDSDSDSGCTRKRVRSA